MTQYFQGTINISCDPLKFCRAQHPVISRPLLNNVISLVFETTRTPSAAIFVFPQRGNGPSRWALSSFRSTTLAFLMISLAIPKQFSAADDFTLTILTLFCLENLSCVLSKIPLSSWNFSPTTFCFLGKHIFLLMSCFHSVTVLFYFDSACSTGIMTNFL